MSEYAKFVEAGHFSPSEGYGPTEGLVEALAEFDAWADKRGGMNDEGYLYYSDTRWEGNYDPQPSWILPAFHPRIGPTNRKSPSPPERKGLGETRD